MIETKKRIFNPIKITIMILFLILGLILLYINQNIIELSLAILFIVISLILFLITIRNNNLFNSSTLTNQYDERSELTRLRGADLSFKFLFVSLSIIIIVFALYPSSSEVFLAFLGPILAFSILIYMTYFYWNERSTE